ncbi:DUF6188 family protein [Allokutzneria sp. A3M-2-11 16]|uniref:DUF6188 family protein n=1 Tax=Allokutzneria sp. A3M-2-11 16 TaxID=2962043 RepID=UPI0020B74DDD|nr:DUF6188 family protein [Allokutzneria sp. A3M-2-11 16]MCP3799112.1 DUF6188 family protein [Allokutzneria sp. A3M-2-11 16]
MGKLIRLDDRWVLPYRGMEVTQIRVDHTLTFVLSGDAVIVVEGEAELSTPDGPVRLRPERQKVAEALALVGTKLTWEIIFKNGVLHLGFDNGYHLTVEPDARHEAWSATGPGKLRVVCTPGGEITTWGLT